MANKTSPGLTADLRRGDETQVLLKLQNAGVSADDYAAIATNGAMRREIVDIIFRHRLFSTPEEQVRCMLLINQNRWHEPGITSEAIQALGDPPPCPVSDENGLYCVTLLYETGDTAKTFRRNWEACAYVHGDQGVLKLEGMELSDGVRRNEHALVRTPGLHWAVVELGRKFKGKNVGMTRWLLREQRARIGLGAELPFIAAMHPKWAVSMNGTTIPFMDAPDLDVKLYGSGFIYAPCISFSSADHQIRLGLSRAGSGDARLGCGSFGKCSLVT